MKFLLVLAVLAVAFYVWRSGRDAADRHAGKDEGGGKAPPRTAPGKPLGPQEMVRCAACDLHLPRADAHAGRLGLLYCSEEHRLGAER